MYNDPLVKIKNITRMSKHIGKDVAKSMSIPIDELKNFIRPKEIKSIIQQYSIKKEDEYHINSLILKKVFNEVNNWILGIQLCGMAVRGELETCWDSEQNCMIFEASKGEKHG